MAFRCDSALSYKYLKMRNFDAVILKGCHSKEIVIHLFSRSLCQEADPLKALFKNVSL